MKIISPTGKGIRVDAMGSGKFGAPRGNRRHKGTDFLCDPGQSVVAPVSGIITRIARPYATGSYSGCVIDNRQIQVKIFYINVPENLIGKGVDKGEYIGIAQDISLRYGSETDPHVHLQIEKVDPELLMGE